MLCPNDLSASPAATCRLMDFTIGFELRFLILLPNALSIVLLLGGTLFLYKKDRITKASLDALAIVKLVTALLQAALSLSILVLSSVARPFGSKSFSWLVAAYALQFAFSLALLVASYVHHTRSITPSTLIALSLFLGVLFSVTHLRTLALVGTTSHGLLPLYGTFAGLRFIQLISELAEKRSLLKPSFIPKARESSSSIVSRVTFLFLLPLLWKGRHTALRLDSLHDEFGLPPFMSSTLAGPALLRSLTVRREKGGGFLWASVRPFLMTFSSPIPPKLGFIAATFAQPFVVQAMLSFIQSSNYDGKLEPVVHGWGLVGAYAAVYLSIAVTTAIYWDKVYASVLIYRAALVSVIFEKSLRLSTSVVQSEGSGAAVTYMSVDVERVVEGAVLFHEAWSALLSVVVAAVILWYQASYAMLAALGVVLLFLVVTAIIAGTVQGAQTAWMGATQNRIKFISSIMENIFPIKLSALESQVPYRVTPLRELEIQKMKAFYRRIMTVAVLSTATVNFAGVAALGTYVGVHSELLRPEKLFTILTIVNLVTLPISTIGHVFPQLLASFGSLARIAKFLDLEEKDAAPSSSSLLSTCGTLNSPNVSSDLKQTTQFPDSLSHMLLDEKQPAADQCVLMGDIVLQNASFGLEENGNAILEDLNCTFTASNLTMIIGPVGSGKSLLLASLLRETHLLSGSCTPLRGAVAYVAQDPFLWPTTIRENIVFGTSFNAAWYSSVLKACKLEEDIQRIVNGDQALVGENGASISGGQKQRIALARAVYSNADIILLDDSFSALDSHTAAAVFDMLLGPQGLLRGRTVILNTHSRQHLPFADRLMVLSNGRVIAEGSWDSLVTDKFDITQFVGESKSAYPQAAISTLNTKQPSEIMVNTEVAKILAEKPLEGEVSGKPHEKDDDEEMGVLGSAGWAPYKFFLRACGWSRLAAAFFCLIAYTLMEVGLQIYLKYWSESNTTRNAPWLGGYAAFAIGVAASGLIALFSYTLHTIPHASAVIHSVMTEAILRAPITYFQAISSSRLINRYSGDMNIIDFAFPVAILDFTFTVAFVIGALVLMFLAVPWLAISVPVLGYMYWHLQKFYLATSRQLQRLEMSSKTPLLGAFSTTLSGLATIRAFRAENTLRRQSNVLLDRSQVPMYYRNAGIRFLRTMLSIITLFMAVAISAIAVGLRGSTSAGFLGVSLSQLVGFSTSLQNVILAWTRVENGVVALERVHEICKVSPEHKNSPPERDSNSMEWPSAGKIEFKNFSLRYKPDLDPALRKVNLKIAGGSKIGICGRTGSGKSTAVFALLGGGDPSLIEGQLLIDGIDITNVHPQQLRSSISVVSQNPLLLHMTIRENLTIGFGQDPPQDDQIWDSLHRVGMRDVISALPQKLDYVLAPGGSEFSRGERQLLCIARVLLEKRKIVILDEASSSMDSKTEERLQQVLATDLAGCTCIAVAHRIASIIDFDAVAVLDYGRVIETGQPHDLIQVPESRFRSLASNQGLV